MRSRSLDARSFTAAIFTAGLGASAALGQSNVEPANKHAWGENIGFINCRDANMANQGVVVRYRRLSGFGWSENCGWINFGDGAPATLPYYANTTGADHGVNVEPNGDCFGLAWGENIGWINFDTRAALGPSNQQARVDRPEGRLRGYAWGENVGWINLDNANIYVGYNSLCPGDYNLDGVIDLADLVSFLGDWQPFIGQAVIPGSAGDVVADGVIDLADLIEFLNEWQPLIGTEC